LGVEEKGQARRRRSWAAGGGAAVGAGVLLAAYLFLHSPFFAVERVDILGANLVSEEEVLRLAGVEYGDNLPRIDPQRVRRRLEEDPRIGAARVRRIPPGRLVLEIEERLPVAMVPYADGFLFIDSEGKLLAADRRSRPGLPAVTGVPLERIGRHLPPPEGLVIAADVASRLPAGLLGNVAEIHVGDPNDVLVLTRDGKPIFLGEPVDVERKLLIAESLLAQEAGRSAAAVDVRVPTVPTLRGL